MASHPSFNKIFSEFIKLGLMQQFGNIVIIIIEAAFHREHLSSPAREGWCEAMSQYREIWIEGRYEIWRLDTDTAKSERTGGVTLS